MCRPLRKVPIAPIHNKQMLIVSLVDTNFTAVKRTLLTVVNHSDAGGAGNQVFVITDLILG